MHVFEKNLPVFTSFFSGINVNLHNTQYDSIHNIHIEVNYLYIAIDINTCLQVTQ